MGNYEGKAIFADFPAISIVLPEDNAAENISVDISSSQFHIYIYMYM